MTTQRCSNSLNNDTLKREKRGFDAASFSRFSASAVRINKMKADELVTLGQLSLAAGAGLGGAGGGVGFSVLLTPALRVLFVKLRSKHRSHRCSVHWLSLNMIAGRQVHSVHPPDTHLTHELQDLGFGHFHVGALTPAKFMLWWLCVRDSHILQVPTHTHTHDINSAFVTNATDR